MLFEQKIATPPSLGVEEDVTVKDQSPQEECVCVSRGNMLSSLIAPPLSKLCFHWSFKVFFGEEMRSTKAVSKNSD